MSPCFLTATPTGMPGIAWLEPWPQGFPSLSMLPPSLSPQDSLLEAAMPRPWAGPNIRGRRQGPPSF